MKKIYEYIVNHPKLILSVFMILFVICSLCKPFVSVNYDMNDYLPTDTASTIALDKMNEEFTGGIPNARIMLNNVSVPEVLVYKEKIQNVDGVSDVTWLDNVTNIAQPLEIMDTETVETYYKDGNALLTVTIEDDKSMQAVDDIREIIGNGNAMTGSAVSTATATESTVSEISKIAVIAVIFVLIVLCFTTTSWVEPIIILVGLGVAVMLNAGSNLIFGEISFVTNAAGSILQIAVSLDYSVFLIHRFEECRKEESDVKRAMINALYMSTSSILSSGLTTVIGFLALCLMQFEIGPDLGLALAKGIIISLLSVFIFMPVLILYTYKWLDKTHHRSFMPSFKGFGKAVYRIMIPMLLLFVILIVPSYLASNSNNFYYGSSHIFGTETQLGADTEEIEQVFGKSDTYVLIVPKDDLSIQKKLSDELNQIPKVTNIISYVDTVGAEIPEQYLDIETLSKLNSEDYTRMVISVKVDYEGEETFALVDDIRNIASKYYDSNWYLAGQGVSTKDLMDTVTSDMIAVNLLAIGAVFLVLLITMKSLILPTILVLSIETAIWINLAIPYFTDQTIFYIAYLIISSIQLGATVDYAILFTERYKEMRQSFNRKESIIKTISTVTTSILTSGSVLTVVGFLLGYISTHGLLSQLGFFLGKGTLCSLIIVLFILPALLYLSDGLITKKYKEVI
ncbi:MAG: efflux RND transporter permease subunit [Clostridium sp.]|uniref:efflux RND transporter permease subunit n=1 Tax=Clostridium sp. TaxID=1506 RepID=UPI002909A4F6|nr:efflux RND transporter permease subunit [Clostridium sp.]MDU4937712.1 efflux RND transporter permease subunit [Clostridium sp.]